MVYSYSTLMMLRAALACAMPAEQPVEAEIVSVPVFAS